MTEGQFALREDQCAVRETARRFTAERITPFAAQWDEQSHYPHDVWKAAGDVGFGGIYVSQDGGGTGLGRMEAVLVMEAMAYGCPATSAYISIHNMAAWMVDRFGDAQLKSRYLADMVAMDRIASYCLTEPGSGSDAAALRTSAQRDGDDFILNGTKQFISGGGVNDLYLVMARTDPHKTRGISCFLVENGAKGLSFGKPERKLGWNASPTAQVVLDHVRVPATAMVGAPGDGFRIAMSALDGGRLNIAACSIGGAQRCVDEAMAYVRERYQFDQPLADFQNTRFALADMASELEAARSLLYIAADKVSCGTSDATRFAAMAKLIATDTGSAVVDRALQLFGGYGYLRDYPIERFWRDLRVHRILEGTNEVMRLIVARDLLS